MPSTAEAPRKMTDISQLLAVVQIEHVRVVEAHLRTSIKSPDEVGYEIEGKLGHTPHIVKPVKEGLFVVRIDFLFGMHAKGEKATDNSSARVAVNVSFELTYRIPESMSACTAPSECAAERELCELSMTQVMPASMHPNAVMRLPT